MGDATARGSVTVVLPCHNEQDHVGEVLRGCFANLPPELDCQYLVVDDASTDDTPRLLREVSSGHSVSIVRNESSLGFGGSLRKGVSLVRTPWVVFNDTDGQYDPKDILRLLDCREERPLLITGWRVHRADPLIRTLISVGFQSLNRLAFGIRMKDPTTSLKAGPTPAVQKVAAEVRFMNGSFWSEFMVRWLEESYAFKEIPIRHLPRRGGKSRVFEPGQIGRLVLHQFVGLLRLMRAISHKRRSRVQLPTSYVTPRSR